MKTTFVFFHNVNFSLRILALTRPCSGGYLFVCPPEHLRRDKASFAWPQLPWFWSLDPLGISPLTPENAQSLGFPEITQYISASGSRWDTGVYEGLREFHTAKGFDRYSQDLAKHLGCTLMEIAGDTETPHAYGQFRRLTLNWADSRSS
ncbi:hypothetical protein FB45DRAFT_846610 [Roridomyces roridus]|uniref:Uncharacterized protein n=1 Tax=Roridomyces roridus TaxID=1738132 RepID=A0AAD7B1D2_9AGAR|nr:hypothetical protein FB45DRAFT_846610 [Roridomyces roridus]